MFTLCGLILEARENLFRNFWSPFNISFYFSSARNLKKTRTDLRAVSDRDTGPGRLYKPGQPTRANPSRPSPKPPPRRAAARLRPAAAAARHPRSAASFSASIFFQFFRITVGFSSVFLDSVFLNRSVFPVYLNSKRTSVRSFQRTFVFFFFFSD